jgi:chorismate synthase
MPGNTFGTLFTVTTFGESHGPACGCVIDGCPAGLALDREDILRDLRRRMPNASVASTSRAEPDEPEILSGVFEGKTLGTPLAIVIRNTDHHSTDYDTLRDVYRPGHADWTWEAKFGIRDWRGGGRSSGRETVGRVAAGAVARVFLSAAGITVRAWTSSAAGIDVPVPGEPGFDLDEAEFNAFRVPHRDYAARIQEKIEAVRACGDSAGGIVSCSVTGLPPGLGEPVFDKLDARLAQAILSIGATKGIEFGAGFDAAYRYGSTNNDGPALDRRFATNHAGGVLGGISTGMQLEFRVVFKPTPSISRQQSALTRDGSIGNISIPGRHDVCIVPRAVPVVEAMTALVLADAIMIGRGNRYQQCSF